MNKILKANNFYFQRSKEEKKNQSYLKIRRNSDHRLGDSSIRYTLHRQSSRNFIRLNLREDKLANYDRERNVSKNNVLENIFEKKRVNLGEKHAKEN